MSLVCKVLTNSKTQEETRDSSKQYRTIVEFAIHRTVQCMPMRQEPDCIEDFDHRPQRRSANCKWCHSAQVRERYTTWSKISLEFNIPAGIVENIQILLLLAVKKNKGYLVEVLYLVDMLQYCMVAVANV